MSVLAVGLSHRSAPVALLERAGAGTAAAPDLVDGLLAEPGVDEAMLLATCNRIEVYAEVSRFHAGVRAVSELLAKAAGETLDALTPHLYVHYEDRAVQHLFALACGLDSMVVGEAQILGQLRAAYRHGRERGQLHRALGPLVEQALRVGKRAHAETGVDHVASSLVGVAVSMAAGRLGSLAGRSAVVVGAGSMGALALGALRRAGVGELTVANRGPAAGRRLAVQYDARPVGLDRLVETLAGADLVVSATGATGVVVPVASVRAAMAGRGGRPLVVLDLALPRDVDPAAAALDGVELVDLERLRGELDGRADGTEVEAARRIVAEEVAGYLAGLRATRVAPTVTALRTKADEVVAAELARLSGRLPGLDERVRAEVATAVHRVVDKLLHAPTVRVKQLAEAPGGDSYAAALRELFDLNPAAPDALASPGPTPGGEDVR